MAALMFSFLNSMGPRGEMSGLLGVCMVMVPVKPSPGPQPCSFTLCQPRTVGCASPKLSDPTCSASEIVGIFWINRGADAFLWSGLVVWRSKMIG